MSCIIEWMSFKVLSRMMTLDLFDLPQRKVFSNHSSQQRPCIDRPSEAAGTALTPPSAIYDVLSLLIRLSGTMEKPPRSEVLLKSQILQGLLIQQHPPQLGFSLLDGNFLLL